VSLLFGMLADASLPIRLASSLSILRIVSKGLKEPSDKLQLIKVLSLGQVLDALEAKTRQQQIERGDVVDEGEESYREALGRMLSVLGLELAKLTDVKSSLLLCIWFILIQQRNQGRKTFAQKPLYTLNRYYRSCCDSWQTIMTIQLRQSSLSCKLFSPR